MQIDAGTLAWTNGAFVTRDGDSEAAPAGFGVRASGFSQQTFEPPSQPEIKIAQHETAVAPEAPTIKIAHKSVRIHHVRKLPVVPRRDLALDPDGTVDPYQ